jgi:hypothetical protein
LTGAFLGSWTDRLDWHFYFKLFTYITAFIAGPVGILIASLGFLRRTPQNRIGFWWAGSLVFFYLIWGIKTAGLHSYYNLPALGPICFLFGLGMSWIAEQLDLRRAPDAPVQRPAWAAIICLVFAPLIVCSIYLFRQDRTIYDVALWIKNNAARSDLVFLKVNHRRDNNGYPEYPVFSYYAERRAWIDHPFLATVDRQNALNSSTWAVITRPPRESGWTHQIRDMVARYAALQEMPDWPQPSSEFRAVLQNERFTIFRRTTSQH